MCKLALIFPRLLLSLNFSPTSPMTFFPGPSPGRERERVGSRGKGRGSEGRGTGRRRVEVEKTFASAQSICDSIPFAGFPGHLRYHFPTFLSDPSPPMPPHGASGAHTNPLNTSPILSNTKFSSAFWLEKNMFNHLIRNFYASKALFCHPTYFNLQCCATSSLRVRRQYGFVSGRIGRILRSRWQANW